MEERKISEAEITKDILRRNGLKPNRALGQNFLTDDAMLERIAADAQADGLPVWEIGPGLGALTQRLLARAASVTAVEKDALLARILPERFPGAALTVLCADALTTDPDAYMSAEGIHPGGYVIAGNLPYYITTEIAEKMLCAHAERLTFLVQKEAAERFFAGVGERVYGPLPIVTAMYYEALRGPDVPAHCFYPQPEVLSSVVHLVRKKEAADLPEAAGFLRFLHGCFRMRRKTLRNNLRGSSSAEQVLTKPGFTSFGDCRAEALHPEELMRLYRASCGEEI